MERNWYYRVGLYSLITVLSGFVLVPTVYEWSKTKKTVPTWLTKVVDAKITPGLDIQGGLSLLYRPDFAKFFSNAADGFSDSLNRSFASDKKKYDSLIAEVEGEGVLAKVRVFSTAKAPSSVLDSLDRAAFAKLVPDLVLEKRDTNQIWLSFSQQYIKRAEDDGREQATLTINRRVNERGVVEPTIQVKQEDIAVELPGNQAAYKNIKQYIENPAQLDFRIVVPQDKGGEYVVKVASFLNSHQVDYPGVHVSYNAGQVSFESANKVGLQKWLDAMAGFTGEYSLPKGQKWFLGEKRVSADSDDDKTDDNNKQSVKKKSTQDIVYQSYLLFNRVEMTGRSLTKAEASVGTLGEPIVLFVLDKEGGEKFSEITGANINGALAIVLDDQVMSVASIGAKLTGTQFQITMGGSMEDARQAEEAKRIATTLQVGALPISLKLISMDTIGAALGDDVIERAKIAMLVGALVVILFMLIYYRMAGLIANISMICNIIYLLALMAMLRATLTLPGIAAIVLSVGMAVDANIIIYERIREELRLGKTPKAAVDAGFNRAFWTVVDAHVVGFVAGVVLYSYGNGPIRGFAVSLMAGIVCNLFTSVWLSKAMFDWVVRDRKKTTLSI